MRVVRLGLASAATSAVGLLLAAAFLRVVRLGLASAAASAVGLLSAAAFLRVVRLGLASAAASVAASAGALPSVLTGAEVVVLGERGANSKP